MSSTDSLQLQIFNKRISNVLRSFLMCHGHYVRYLQFKDNFGTVAIRMSFSSRKSLVSKRLDFLHV